MRSVSQNCPSLSSDEADQSKGPGTMSESKAHLTKRHALPAFAAALISLGIQGVLSAQEPAKPETPAAVPAAPGGTEVPAPGSPVPGSPADVAAKAEAEKLEKYPELKEAIELIKQAKFAECLEKLNEAKKAHPELPTGRLLYAEILLRGNQIGAGRMELESAVTEAPDDPRGYLTLGGLAANEGRLTDAFLEFNEALKRAENFDFHEDKGKEKFIARTSIGRATVYERRKDWKNALADFEAALAVDPKDGNVRQRMARCFVQLGDNDRAMKELQQAKADTPSVSPPETAMATFYANDNQHEKAEEMFRKGIEADPSNPIVYSSFAQWLYSRNRGREAKEVVMNGLQTLPEARDLRTLRAILARHLKAYEEAEAELDDLLRDQPNNGLLINELALALVEQQDPQKQRRAMEIAVKLVQANSKSPDFVSTFGWVNYRMGQMDRAKQALDLAIKLAGTQVRPDIYYYFAHILTEEGKNDEVKKLLTKIVQAEQPFAFKDDATQWLERLNASATPPSP
ncbi:tetratricopeptide repeat protein [bacterium]|nr:tetratricopeptide repeat protein [bacterium]